MTSNESNNNQMPNVSGNQIQPDTFDAPSSDISSSSGFKWGWRHSLASVASILVLLLIIFMVSAKAILITTNAENTQISLNGGTSFKLNEGRYLVIKGNYELSLKAQGYVPRDIALEVTSETVSSLSYELTPLPGRIRAKFSMTSQNGDPVKGIMRLNGSGLGPTNEFLFKDLQPGEYEIRADAYLYETKTISVEVRGREITEEVVLELDPNWGYLNFSVTPEDAQLFIGNQPLEISTADESKETPDKTALVETGLSKLVLKREGYKDWPFEVDIARDEQIDLGDIVLEPVDTQYTINTEPTGCLLYTSDAADE